MKKKMFLMLSLIFIICLFFRLGLIYFLHNVNIKISTFLYLKEQKSASLVFDEIKDKKVASTVFWEIEIKNKNLPASSVFQKSGLKNTCLCF